MSDPTVVTQSPESSSDEETDDGEGTREANRRVGTNGAGRPARSDAASGSGRVDAALKPRDAGSGRARYRKRRTSRERRWDRPIDERAELETDAKTGLGFARGAERRDARSDDDLFAATMTATNDDRASRSSESKSGWSSMRANASARSPASAEDAAVDGDLAGVGFGGLGGFSGGGGGGGNRGDGDGRRDRSDDRGDKRVYRGKALTQRIKQLGDRRRLDEVLALAAASPIPTTTNGRRITVGAVIGACCKCGDLERGMRLLRQLDGPDGCGAGAPAYCALIQAHGRAGRLREALELLEAWEKGRGPRDGKIGVGRNGTIYVAGSLKWRKKDVPLRGEKWRDEMGVTWHAPRVAQSRMLLTVLDACASCGDVARARFFKTKLLAWDGRVVDGRVAFDGVSDAEAAWNAVAKAHANSDDPLTALPVLREMETDPSDPVAPTQVSYNIALKACQRGGRPDWARALIARMRAVAARTGDADMYPDAVSYTTAARAEAAAARGFAGDQHAGGVQAVDAMYAEVRGPLGPPPDPQCYAAIIDAFVAHGEVARALAAVAAAEREPGVDLSARAYLGVMRAFAAAGDVRGVAALAARLEAELARRAARRRRRPRGAPAARAESGPGSLGSLSDASSAAAAASMGGDLRGSFGSLGAAVEAEVVMCEAEAKAAAGDAAGARGALERLKRLDYGSASKVLRDRSTELLVSLFVKDIVGKGSESGRSSQEATRDAATVADGDAPFDKKKPFDETALAAAGDALAAEAASSRREGEALDFSAEKTPAWSITQALDLIDSAWGFASLDEDDEFLPSLDEDDIPVPAAGGFGGFLAGAVKRGEWSDIAEGPYPGGGDWTSPDFLTSPTLRSAEAADALELWTGAASRLFAGDTEPLVFRGGVDPEARLCDARELGATLDEDDDCSVDWSAAGAFSGASASATITETSETSESGPSSRLPNAFVVRVDALAGPAAAAVGRDVVAVVVDDALRPVGTLLGSADASEMAAGVCVRDVMGPKPTVVFGDDATVGDVAIVCAAAALDEPVAVVDAEGKLRRVLRREDLLLPARERKNDPR